MTQDKFGCVSLLRFQLFISAADHMERTCGVVTKLPVLLKIHVSSFSFLLDTWLLEVYPTMHWAKGQAASLIIGLRLTNTVERTFRQVIDVK